MKSNIAKSNILVLPPVSMSSNPNHRNNNNPNPDLNKENKLLQPKNSENNSIENNSQNNIVDSPNLKKAISKYSEVPENFDLNKDNSLIAKVFVLNLRICI